jgi:hypothetical protein
MIGRGIGCEDVDCSQSSGEGPATGYCEHGNKHSVCIKGGGISTPPEGALSFEKRPCA